MSTETALITGASSGIGLELARLFAADGSNLVLVARNAVKLEQLATDLRQKHGVDVRLRPTDLADPGAPGAIYDELTASGTQIDVLVNCAGFGKHGQFAEIPLPMELEMIQVNIAASTHLTGLFLPSMIQRGRGGVLNVGSTAAFQPGPKMAVYFATKAYILSISEALAEELVGTGLKVSCLAPGPTATGFFEVAGSGKALGLKLGIMDPRTVALAGYRGFRKGKVVVVPGLTNKLIAFSIRLTPRALVRKVANWLVSEG